MVYAWIIPVIDVNKRVKGTNAKPKAKSIRAKHQGRRIISQETVRQLREQYALLPRGPNGGVRHGEIQKLLEAHGLTYKAGHTAGYYYKLIAGELRDDQRE